MKPFPYRIVIGWSSEDEAFIARIPALPGAGGDGKTEQRAIDAAKSAAASVLEVMRTHGDPIPPGDLEERRYSGQLRLRLPCSLHRNLAEAAELEGISLNQLMVVYLAAEHARRSPTIQNKSRQPSRYEESLAIPLHVSATGVSERLDVPATPVRESPRGKQKR